MAKELVVTEEYRSRLYDSSTGVSCVTEKVVDITEDCLLGNPKDRCILLFTRAKRGRIAQISRPYENEAYEGMCTHFFVEELDHEMRARPWDDAFGLWARQLGITKLALRSLIDTHAPA